MFGGAFGELAFGENYFITPPESSVFQLLLVDPVARRVFLVEIYPYQF